MKLFNKSFGILSCLVIAGAFSASPAHALVDFSVKGGVNLNTFSASRGDISVSGSTSGMGYMGGIGLDFGVGPIGAVADVLYTQRGYKLTPTSETETATSIHIPVQARFSIIPMLSLTGGAYFAKTLDDNGKDDMGLVAGVGLSLPLAVTSLTLEARYNFGTKNLLGANALNIEMKNRSIDILAGLTF